MAEVGIDIAGYRSKSVLDLPDIEFDYVITLCDDAQQACPFFPAKTAIIHHGFEDPPKLAEGPETKRKQWYSTGVCGTRSGRILKHCPNPSMRRFAKRGEGT